MNLTEEQKEVVYSEKDKIFVKSVAGSGKTTTLIEYAKNNFNKKILVLMFNKDLRASTRLKMPCNCEVHTINSLAFFYSRYKDRFIVDNLTVVDVLEILDIRDIDLAFKYLNGYISYINNIPGDKDLGANLYETMKRKKTKVDHLFILKEFSVSKEIEILYFDILMIDEAQDINPVMIEIIQKIKHKKDIAVGDPKQSIYKFMNNISLLDSVYFQTHTKYTLSKSFRFGEEIAEIVNEISYKMYKEEVGIIGNENIKSIITKENVFGPYSAYICRTNAHLFEKAIEYALSDMKISIPFDWEELKLNLFDLIYLKIGLREKIQNKLFKKYEDYNILKKSLKINQSKDISYLIRIIDKYDISIIEYISLLEKYLSSPKYADIILITAHKSKGLEFLYVEYGEDFNFKNEEEKNLTYVALTRPIKELNINNLKWSKL